MARSLDQAAGAAAPRSAAPRCLRAPAAGSGAASKTLNVLCHRVHQNSLTTGVAGDLTKPWREAQRRRRSPGRRSTPTRCRTGCSARRASTRPISASASSSNSRATPNAATLLQPLDDYRPRRRSRISATSRRASSQAMTIGGKLIAVPFRTATIGLFYNEALLEERGIKAPPTTLEELVDQAKQLTFRSQAGTPVVGMVVASDLAAFPVIVRARLSAATSSAPTSSSCPIRPRWRRRSPRSPTCTRPARCRAPTPPRRTTTRSPGCSRAAPRSRCCRSRAIAQLNKPGPVEISRQDQGGRVSDLGGAQGQGADGVGASNSGRCAFPPMRATRISAWSFIRRRRARR